MSLTPEEIAGKEFTFGLRGYDQEEVRAFLQLVATQVELVGDGTDGAGADVSEDQAARAAAVVLEHAHTEADEIRQSASAEAEMTRARARAVLAAAQDEALRLVAETHARIDRRFGGAGTEGAGGDAPASTVEQLGEEISAMVKARDDVLHQLQEVKERLDLAVTAAEADPVLGRKAVEAG